MEDELSFRNWLLALEMAPPIAGAGAAGKNLQQDIEDAISSAPEGGKVDAAQQAVQKMQQSQQAGGQTSVKDAITVAAATDKISKEVGKMGVAAMKKKMAKKMKKK